MVRSPSVYETEGLRSCSRCTGEPIDQPRPIAQLPCVARTRTPNQKTDALCLRFALPRLPEAVAPRCDPVARTTRSVTPLVAQVLRVASHLAFLERSPSGCPNDQPPGARVRRTPLPKCFASSACKVGPKASLCLVPVSGDRRICSRWTELAQGVSESIFKIFFDAQECPQNPASCPPISRQRAESSTAAYTGPVEIRTTIFSSRCHRRPVVTGRTRPPPHRPHLDALHQPSHAPRRRVEGPPDRPPVPSRARRRSPR